MPIAIKTLLTLAVWLLAQSSNAGIISGDFRAESDLPYTPFSAGPVVLESLGASVGAGPELDALDLIANPTPWQGGIVHMDLDPISNILLLESRDTLNFQTWVGSITNIVLMPGEAITGISHISGNLTDLALSEILVFTASSVSVSYDIGGPGSFRFSGSTAAFQIEVSGSSGTVPVPATIALLGLGLLTLLAKQRQRASIKVIQRR